MTPRVLAEPGSLGDGVTIELADDELHHLRVRRIGAGDKVVVLDGAGRSAPGTIVHHDGSLGVALGVVQVAPARSSTVLAVGAGDKDRFLLLAERCTELSVTQLIPIETERSRAVDTRLRGSTLERARRRAREACKQSGNPWASVVGDPCELSAVAADRAAWRWLLADATGHRCPALTADQAVGWVIGPEGGLTHAEAEYCRSDLGAEPVALGPAILRFDTAAVAAAVITLDRRRAG